MHYLAGAFLIVVGLVIILFGDREVEPKDKGGMIAKIFTWPQEQAAWMKWPIGIAIAGIGVWFILYGAGRV